MLITELALVSETTQINCSQLNRVAAALQKQAIRDLRGTWHLTSTIDGFETLDDVPIGYWPIIVRDDINEPGAAGIHLDRNGQPYALVQYSDSWSLTASHEVLEMLVDPFGNRLVAGQSPKPDQGRVEFLVEVSDPPEGAEFGYTVNGFLVSDFITPSFYDPVTVPGVRYSFGGNIAAPRTILPGGYISWHEPVTDHWWQQVWFGTPEPRFRDLGRLTERTGSLRSAIDARTNTSLRVAESGPQSDRFADARAFFGRVVESTSSRAEGLRAEIEVLRGGAVAEGTWEDAEDDGG